MKITGIRAHEVALRRHEGSDLLQNHDELHLAAGESPLEAGSKRG